MAQGWIIIYLPKHSQLPCLHPNLVFCNMPIKRTSILYTVSLFTAGTAMAIVLMVLLGFSRQGLINFIVQASAKPYLLNILQQQIITPQKFKLLKAACYALLAIDVVLVAMLYRYRRVVLRWLVFLRHCVSSGAGSIAAVFKRSSKKNNLAFAILLAVITARALYYIFHFELQYDEMWSYNYFTARPFYFAMLSYNNYPLYELSTQLFKWLPFSMKFNLRLPVFLAGITACIIIYACIKQYTGHALTALAAMALFACMPVTTFYMLYARGVMFGLLFSIVSMFSILYMFTGNNPKKYMLLFALANIAGMYSMPTHLYLWAIQIVCAAVYSIKYNRSLLKPFMVCNLLVLMLSLVCWLPIIAGSGISFLLNTATNSALVGSAIPDIIFYNKGISTFFTGEAYGLLVMVGVTVFLLAASKKINSQNVFLVAFMLLLFGLPTAIYVVQHNAIPERSIPFIGLLMPMCFCWLVYTFKNNLPQFVQYVFIALLFVAGCFISNSHSFMRWSEVQDKKAITITILLMQHHVKTCYDNSTASQFFYYYPALEYYYAQHKLAITVNMATRNSQRYKPLLPTDDFDCIIVPANASTPSIDTRYKSIYKDDEDGFVIMAK